VKVTNLFIALTLLTCIVLQAQPQKKDSLENLLKQNLTNTARVDVYNQLAYQYYDFNDTIAVQYANKALDLSKQTHYTKGLKYAYTMVGLGYSSHSKFKEAIEAYRLSGLIKVPDTKADDAYNLSLMGNCYRDMGDYDSALIIYDRAKSMYKTDKSIQLSIIYKNIAILQLLLWKNKEAIMMADSASIYVEGDDNMDQFVQMDIWSIYGQAYKNALQFTLSQTYYDKMCNASTSLEDYYHQILCELNKAELEYEKSNFATSLT
jgi:tetratricopeptide (TPR) repeat protein